MMDTTVIIERLIALAQLDYDIMCAYEETLKRIGGNDQDLHENLILYRNDHAMHINTLVTSIADLGGSVPALSPEARGTTTEGVMSLTGIRGTGNMLETLRSNEVLIRKAYTDVLADPSFSSYPPDLQEHLKNDLHDEEHHLAFIDSALEALTVPAE